MTGEPKQSRSATTALIYLTTGALIDVWTVIYYVYLWRHGGSDTAYLVCHGCFFSGLVLLCIGLALGRIGNYAKQAEVGHPPNSVAPIPATPVSAVPPQTNGVIQQTAPVMAVPPTSAPVMVAPPMQTARS
jgi:hypothetical protein